MSRLLDRIRKEAWDERREFGLEGRHPRDKRLVAGWFKNGHKGVYVESAHMEALDWLQRRLEASHATGLANGERVACTRSPDGSRASQQDAMNDVNGALAAVRTRAGQQCSLALFVLIHEPRIKFRPLRAALKCDQNRVFPIVLHALEALAQYREDCIADRARWNRRPFVP